MLLIMLFSSFFIAAHADHECSGADCPVCACIQQCENTIWGMGSGAAAILAVIMPVIIFLRSISMGVPSILWDTPVSTKVRLNN